MAVYYRRPSFPYRCEREIMDDFTMSIIMYLCIVGGLASAYFGVYSLYRKQVLAIEKRIFDFVSTYVKRFCKPLHQWSFEPGGFMNKQKKKNAKEELDEVSQAAHGNVPMRDRPLEPGEVLTAEVGEGFKYRPDSEYGKIPSSTPLEAAIFARDALSNLYEILRKANEPGEAGKVASYLSKVEALVNSYEEVDQAINEVGKE